MNPLTLSDLLWAREYPVHDETANNCRWVNRVAQTMVANLEDGIVEISLARIVSAGHIQRIPYRAVYFR